VTLGRFQITSSIRTPGQPARLNPRFRAGPGTGKPELDLRIELPMREMACSSRARVRVFSGSRKRQVGATKDRIHKGAGATPCVASRLSSSAFRRISTACAL
jgi:hypothetical protein